jgi:hypothetical protein
LQAAVESGDLLTSARAGDAAAFSQLLDPLWDPAYRLAFSCSEIAKLPKMLFRIPH